MTVIVNGLLLGKKDLNFYSDIVSDIVPPVPQREKNTRVDPCILPLPLKIQCGLTFNDLGAFVLDITYCIRRDKITSCE
jgi:hypothetical protein